MEEYFPHQDNIDSGLLRVVSLFDCSLFQLQFKRIDDNIIL